MDAGHKKIEMAKLGLERTKIRLDYLVRQYGFYTGHMNQVFNYYLIAAALVPNAFVQSMVGSTPLDPNASRYIAIAGALMSVLFGLLHWRAFQIAGVLDNELATVEPRVGASFSAKRKASQNFHDFAKPILTAECYERYAEAARKREADITPAPSKVPPFFGRLADFRNSSFFPFIYILFSLSFILAACAVDHIRGPARVDTRDGGVQVSISQSASVTRGGTLADDDGAGETMQDRQDLQPQSNAEDSSVPAPR